MKKKLTVCLLAALMLLLCACGQATQPETVSCGHEAYSDLIARLEAGDYNGARSLIDTMEGRQIPAETVPATLPQTAPAVQTEATLPPAVTDSGVTADVEIVELTIYNMRDYFTFEEEYYISEASGCTQYITLKEEYRNRLLSVENVKLEVTYLLCNAFGKIDLEEEEFQSEYFDVISREKETKTLELDSNGMGWISRMLYFSRKGYFPDFAMDVEIESASGKLVLSAQ